MGVGRRVGTGKMSHTPVKCGPCLRQCHSGGQPSPGTENPCQARPVSTSTLEEPSCGDLVTGNTWEGSRAACGERLAQR